jgi:hypothetical protein
MIMLRLLFQLQNNLKDNAKFVGLAGIFSLRKKLNFMFFTTWPLEVGPIGLPETLLNNYQSTMRSNPEERGSQNNISYMV